MKIHLPAYLLILGGVLLGGPAFAQSRVPSENENAKKRAEFFANRKKDQGSAHPEHARWLAYQESQSKWMESSRAPVAGWQCLGPVNQGGRIISHAFDPTNVNTIWAGSASGGLWRSTDGAATWTAMTDNIPNLAVGAVAIKPGNTSIMLMGTGEGYLLSSWLQYGIGVLRSTDGGNTWGPTSLTVDDSLQFASLGFAWDPVNTDNVYIATTYGIFASADAGISWTISLTGIATSVQINKNNPAILYAALQDYPPSSSGGIYRSADYGMTWTLLGSGLPLPSETGFTALAICDSFPNVLYAGISRPAADPDCGTMQGLYKTSDGGSTWSTVNTSGIDFYCYPAPFDYICQGWYGNVLQIAYNDPSTVFVGGVYLYSSTDGGTTWNYSDWAPAESPAWMHPDHHSFGFSPLDPDLIYSFNDGGVYKSTNAGATWTKKPNGMVTTQFYFISSSPADPQLMVGGTQDNGVYVNSLINTNQNWSQAVPGDGFSSAMDPSDADVWYTSELFNGRLKTTDGGITYDTIENGITDPTAFIIALAMDPENDQVLYTGTDVNIYKTTDGGANWVPLSNKPYITVIGIDKINPDTVYITNDPSISVSYIYRSFNGGSSWSYIAGPGNKVTDLETSPAAAGTLFVSRGTYTPGQQIYKSTNAGASWINITGDLPAIPVNCITIDPTNSNFIYAGTDLGVYISTTGGFTWTPFNDNFPLVMVTDMHYYAADSTIRVGTHGRGIWKTKAALTVSVEELPAAGSSLSAHPNPAEGEVTIAYQLKAGRTISIKVYNALGQEVVELLNAKQGAGKHTLAWNRKNEAEQEVSPGIYYVRMVQEGRGESLKLIIK